MENVKSAGYMKSGGSKQIPPEVFEALESVWKTDVVNAEKVLIARQNKSKATNIWVELALAEVYLWKFGFSEKDEIRKQISAQLSKLEKLGEFLCDEHDPNSIGSKLGNLFSAPVNDKEEKLKQLRFLDGLIVTAVWHIYTAIWQFRNEEKIKGAFHFQRSWAKLSEILEAKQRIRQLKVKIDPSLDGLINFGVGLFHFIFSLIPPHLQTITSIVGFVADRDKAIHELEKAIESGCYWAPLAVLLLVGLKHYFLNEKEEAEELLRSMQEAYPNAVVVCFASAMMEKVSGRPEKAIPYLEKARTLAPQNVHLEASTNYQIAFIYFQLNDWDHAIPLFEKFLESPVKEERDKSLRPYASYLLGLCYWMSDPSPATNKALVTKISKLYVKAKDWYRPDESYDIFTQKKTEQFLSSKQFDSFDILFVQADALKDGKQWDRALGVVELMKQAVQKASPDAWWHREGNALCLYLEGCCLRGLKKIRRSLRSLQEDHRREAKDPERNLDPPIQLAKPGRNSHRTEAMEGSLRGLWEDERL